MSGMEARSGRKLDRFFIQACDDTALIHCPMAMTILAAADAITRRGCRQESHFIWQRVALWRRSRTAVFTGTFHSDSPTAHQLGHRTLCGVRVASQTIFCSAGISGQRRHLMLRSATLFGPIAHPVPSNYYPVTANNREMEIPAE